jgi:hypothetical protein
MWGKRNNYNNPINMNKIFDSRLVSEYPGLVRTIRGFDEYIIEIEFNFQYSNEVGIIFRKKYTTLEEIGSSIKQYLNSSIVINAEDNDEVIRKSHIKLMEDTVANNVHLPDSANGYIYKGNIDNLAKHLNYLKSNNS